MSTFIPLKLTQLLEDNKNLESIWVIRFIVIFNKKFNFLFKT
jgi:hypothetical protein